ncbi:MAG TPA: M23 family peptidase, partial [Epsilonproteobacteria bacterium]|nr:M23 family peptidase [Campylobacterota bacterium]
MRIFIVSLLCISWLLGMHVEYRQWEKGKTFSDYMHDRNISASLLESISKEDQKFLLEIRSDYGYYELLDDNNTLQQSLIPISKEMQVHLFKKENA